MSLLQDFEKFALRGNIIDLAIGVIIGTAFNKIVSSMVDGIIMPLLGLVIGGINIAGQTFTVRDAVVKWGDFLQNALDFIIIAFTIFIVLRLITLMRQKQEAAAAAAPPPAPSREEMLLTEIRDLLKSKNA